MAIATGVDITLNILAYQAAVTVTTTVEVLIITPNILPCQVRLPLWLPLQVL